MNELIIDIVLKLKTYNITEQRFVSSGISMEPHNRSSTPAPRTQQKKQCLTIEQH